MEVLLELRSGVARTHFSSFWRGEAIKGCWNPQTLQLSETQGPGSSKTSSGKSMQLLHKPLQKEGSCQEKRLPRPRAQSLLVGTKNNGSSGLWARGMGSSPTAPPHPASAFTVSLYHSKEGEEDNQATLMSKRVLCKR